MVTGRSANKEKFTAYTDEDLRRFQLIAEALGGVIYDFDAVQNKVMRTGGLIDLLGYEPKDADPFPQWWESRIHNEDMPRFEKAFREASSRCQVEYRIRHRDGHYVHVWDQSLIVRDKEGRILRVIGVNLDITRHRESISTLERLVGQERAMREESEHRLEQLLQLHRFTAEVSDARSLNSVGSMVLGELSGSFKLARAAVIFRRAATKFELVGQQGIAAEQVGELLRAIEDLFSTQTDMPSGELVQVNLLVDQKLQFTRIFPLQATDGTWKGAILIGESGLPLNEEQTRQVLTICRQCASALDRVEFFEAEQEARKRAEEANRAKDEFVGIISHELRSPLQAILGWTKMLRAKKLPKEGIDRALEIVEQSALTQAQLLGDLLDLTRLTSGKLSLTLKPHKIVTIAQEVIDSVKPAAADKQIIVTLVEKTEIPECIFDAQRIKQSLTNIVSNAIKFTPPFGAVTIKIALENELLCIAVSDTGEGIPAEFLPYVFEKFRQSDLSKSRRHGGLGLGLALVKYFVELHAGTVRAESDGQGRGSTITIHIPFRHGIPSESENTASKEAFTPYLNLKTKRILVIEDEIASRSAICEALLLYEAVLTEAASAEEARACFEKGKFDLILTDIGLPGTDGVTLIEELRRSCGSESFPPAVALTAYAGTFHRNRIEEGQFKKVLLKPLDPVMLIEVIDEIFEANTGR